LPFQSRFRFLYLLSSIPYAYSNRTILGASGSLGLKACAAYSAGDGELNQGVAALVCAYASMPIDLDPLYRVGCGRALSTDLP
jgi:hypothetical protein